jgi:hypothetical protein
MIQSITVHCPCGIYRKSGSKPAFLTRVLIKQLLSWLARALIASMLGAVALTLTVPASLYLVSAASIASDTRL